MKLFNIDLQGAEGGGWINRIHNLDAETVREKISNGIESNSREIVFVFRLAENRNQYKSRVLICRGENREVQFIYGTVSLI